VRTGERIPRAFEFIGMQDTEGSHRRFMRSRWLLRLWLRGARQ